MSDVAMRLVALLLGGYCQVLLLTLAVLLGSLLKLLVIFLQVVIHFLVVVQTSDQGVKSRLLLKTRERLTLSGHL